MIKLILSCKSCIKRDTQIHTYTYIHNNTRIHMMNTQVAYTHTHTHMIASYTQTYPHTQPNTHPQTHISTTLHRRELIPPQRGCHKDLIRTAIKHGKCQQSGETVVNARHLNLCKSSSEIQMHLEAPQCNPDIKKHVTVLPTGVFIHNSVMCLQVNDEISLDDINHSGLYDL